MWFTKLFVVQLLLLLGISAYSQVGSAIVTPDCHGVAYLYKNPVSQIIVDSLKNDSIYEVYYCVIIIKSTKNRALISTFIDDGEFTTHQGWVDWKNLGIRLNCDTISIRRRPYSTSKVRNIIKMPDWRDIYSVKRAQEGWLHIRDKKQGVDGWVSPKDQCANPYTICN